MRGRSIISRKVLWKEIVTDGLLHYWPLDEYSDGTVPVTRKDVAGNTDLVEMAIPIPSITIGESTGISNSPFPLMATLTEYLDGDFSVAYARVFPSVWDSNDGYSTLVLAAILGEGASGGLSLSAGVKEGTEVPMDLLLLNKSDLTPVIYYIPIPELSGVPYNYVITYKRSTGTFSIYINSTRVFNEVVGDLITSIGLGYSIMCTGVSAQLRVYNKCLSQDEIDTINMIGV